MDKRVQLSLLGILILMGLLFSGRAEAQRYTAGQRALQFTGGVTGEITESFMKTPAYYAGVAFSSYTKNSNRWVAGIEFLNSEHLYKTHTIPVSRFIGDGGYYIKLLSDNKKTFFLSFGLSASMGYETINWGEKLLYDGATIQNKDAFIYGGSAIAELEIFLSDKVALLINGRERLLFGTSVEKFQTHYGVGVKFMIN